MRLVHALMFAGLAALPGCSVAGSPSHDGTPVTGAWGGPHAALVLTSSGGTISYDCAHGNVGAPIVPAGGVFDVPGFHVRDHGGPVRIDEVPDSVPARYVGEVSGDRMTLRVFAGADTLGPFELRLAAAPLLYRCL